MQNGGTVSDTTAVKQECDCPLLSPKHKKELAMWWSGREAGAGLVMTALTLHHASKGAQISTP